MQARLPAEFLDLHSNRPVPVHQQSQRNVNPNPYPLYVRACACVRKCTCPSANPVASVPLVADRQYITTAAYPAPVTWLSKDAVLRQTPTSPAVRLRAQTARMGRRNARIRSGATSVMGPALRQEIHAKLKSKKWRQAQNPQGKANLEECVDAALTHSLCRAGARRIRPEDLRIQRRLQEGAEEDHRRNP